MIASEIVSLRAAKQHLNVTHDYDDDVISGMLAAAVEVAEAVMGKPVASSTRPHLVRAWILLMLADLYQNRALYSGGGAAVRARVADRLLDFERDYSKVF